MLVEFRDFLKTLGVAKEYRIGKIENAKEKTIGLYSSANLARVESIGLKSSYDIAGFRILLHWTQNMRETEAAARDLFEKLRYITNTEVGTAHVYLIDLDDGEPVFIGTDDNGVYEYHISGRIFYRR